ncbi:1-phosphofructokinase [Treponema zioleckii]|uniref:1-phosphofructokinase n=1 Tax=Treponema zioleckii TaxID=331680 RepID=UPI00168AA00E|nr:1-phosphofructokinase [Treponema zioleckii]
MIYTVTVNPSLDYIIDVDSFKTGTINRTKAEKLIAGGKGINVSIVLHNLGIETRALGFAAGFTGNEIERRLNDHGVQTGFIHVNSGFSRINAKMRSIESDSVVEETEINGQGPLLTKEDLNHLYEKLEELKEGDTLVLAGSIPSTLPLENPQSLYSDIMAKLSGKGVRFVVDATRDLLKKSLAYKPFLVKPNNHELGEIFGVELKTREEVVPYAQKFREMGAQNVLVSMAGEGAVLAAADGKIYKGEAPKCTLVNSVGAGDSMVAGFIAGYQKSGDYKEAFKMGLCTGSASACSEHLADKEQVQKLLENYTGLQE